MPRSSQLHRRFVSKMCFRRRNRDAMETKGRCAAFPASSPERTPTRSFSSPRPLRAPPSERRQGDESATSSQAPCGGLRPRTFSYSGDEPRCRAPRVCARPFEYLRLLPLLPEVWGGGGGGGKDKSNLLSEQNFYFFPHITLAHMD